MLRWNRWISFLLVLTMLLSFPGEIALASDEEAALEQVVPVIDGTPEAPNEEEKGTEEPETAASAPEAAPMTGESVEEAEAAEEAEEELAEAADGGESAAEPAEEGEYSLRTIPVELSRSALFDEAEEPSAALQRTRRFSRALYGRESELREESGSIPVELEVSGWLPENVTVRAEIIEFDERESEGENALFAIELFFFNARGESFTPPEGVSIRVFGRRVSQAQSQNRPLLLYAWREDPERAALRELEYAAQVLVYRDLLGGDERLVYDRNETEAPLLFTEDEGGLFASEEGGFDFLYSYEAEAAAEPLRFLLSAQTAAETEELPADETPVPPTAEEAPTEPETPAEEESPFRREAEGENWTVSAAWGEEAQIPDTARLSVSELEAGSLAYENYVNLTASTLGVAPEDLALTRAFDVALTDPETGEEYHPQAKVELRFGLKDTDWDEELSCQVIYFGESTEVLDTRRFDGIVQIFASGFSVFLVAGVRPAQNRGGQAPGLLLGAGDPEADPDGDPELTAVVTGLQGGDSIHYTLSCAEGESVGSYTVTPTGETEQGSYTVRYEEGSLSIAPAQVTLTAVSAWRNLDGTEKTV